jgi:hypothetical protein
MEKQIEEQKKSTDELMDYDHDKYWEMDGQLYNN